MSESPKQSKRDRQPQELYKDASETNARSGAINFGRSMHLGELDITPNVVYANTCGVRKQVRSSCRESDEELSDVFNSRMSRRD